MSYILSALKKSQQERELGTVPTLDSSLAAPAPQNARRWPWVLGGLLAVNLAVFGGLGWVAGPDLLAQQGASALAALTGGESPGSSPGNGPEPVVAATEPETAMPVETSRPDPQPDQQLATEITPPPAIPAAQPAVETPAAETAATASLPQGQVEPGQAEPAATARVEAPAQPSTNLTLTPAALTTPPVPADPEPAQEVTATTFKTPEPKVTPPQPTKAIFSLPPIPKPKPDVAAKPAIGSSADPTGTQQAALPSAPDAEPEEVFVELPTFRQMSREFRRSFPKLQVSLHMYHEDSEHSFVRINKRKYRTGAKLDDGPRLEEIRPNGIVLNYRGETFLLRN